MKCSFKCAVLAVAIVFITQDAAASYPNSILTASMRGGVHGRVLELRDAGHHTEFCEVFEPCTTFRYSDSILQLVTRKARGEFPWEGEEYRLGVTIFAYLEFDDNLVVRRFELGTFLSADSSTRTDIESILVPVYRDYFAKHVVGRRIRESALSACGGRVDGKGCDDRFARKDSVDSSGIALSNDLSGTLMLRIRTGRPTTHGYFPYDVRLALLSIRIRE
jgi:hypothetical protein